MERAHYFFSRWAVRIKAKFNQFVNAFQPFARAHTKVALVSKCLLIGSNARNQRQLPLCVMVMLKCTPKKKKHYSFKFNIIRPFLVLGWASVKKKVIEIFAILFYIHRICFLMIGLGSVTLPDQPWLIRSRFTNFSAQVWIVWVVSFDWEFCLEKLFGAQSFLFDFI